MTIIYKSDDTTLSISATALTFKKPGSIQVFPLAPESIAKIAGQCTDEHAELKDILTKELSVYMSKSALKIEATLTGTLANLLPSISQLLNLGWGLL